MSAILKIRSEIESRKCFAIKTTIFHYKLTIFCKLHISNDEQFYDDGSSDVKYAPQFLEIILMLFTSSLLFTSWIKTRPAQKLLVRVKFADNSYSYVCEWPPLKYKQTHVCRNSYTGTHTVPDSYTCLCEQALSSHTTQVSRMVSFN